MSHVTTNLTLQLQSLLLRRLSKLPLKRILLTTIPPLFPQTVMPLTFRKRPTLTSLVQRNRMNLMLFAPWAIRLGFFRNIHPDSPTTLHKEATLVLILFTHRFNDARDIGNIPETCSTLKILRKYSSCHHP